MVLVIIADMSNHCQKICQSCGSKYLGGFKAGTQKIEMLGRGNISTGTCDGVWILITPHGMCRNAYEKILHAFANQEADILIGTQMIVKGHDFPNVTLVGVLAADICLCMFRIFMHRSGRFQSLPRRRDVPGGGKEPGQGGNPDV